MSNYTLEDLEVSQLSIKIADKVWDIVLQWNYLAKDTIGKPIIKSSDSIPANISEGYGRYHVKENKQFCFYSRGAKNRKLIRNENYKNLFSELEVIHKKLNSYMKFIGNIAK